MKLNLLLASACLAAALATVGPAQAATYSAVGDYTNTNPSGDGVWSYGTGIGAAQTPLTDSFATCFSVSNFECQTSASDSSVPGVGAVTTGPSASLVGTVLVPNDVLWMHPGDGVNGDPSDVSVVFTAPASGDYDIAGFFERLSTQDSGNGVIVSVFYNNINEGAEPLTVLTYGAEQTFTGNGFLNAGDQLTFDVDNNGEYTFDSTGLSVTISSVPEPATWALLLSGFGGLGAAMRMARRKTAVA